MHVPFKCQGSNKSQYAIALKERERGFIYRKSGREKNDDLHTHYERGVHWNLLWLFVSGNEIDDRKLFPLKLLVTENKIMMKAHITNKIFIGDYVYIAFKRTFQNYR